jgi:sugar phosphate isomerase/epimerase
MRAAAGVAGGLVLSADLQAAKKIKQIGLQLYTVRDEMKKDFESALERVARIGYREVEFAGYFEREPRQVRRILDTLRLRSPSSHVGLTALTEDLPREIETAKILGQKYLVCPSLPNNLRKTADDYRKLAAQFNRIGADCRKAGLSFAYHNHAFEFEAIDGQIPYDILLSETDPKLVWMEMDLYWVVRANHDPVAYFQKHPGRFVLFHVKDMQDTPERGFTEVGRGTIDFKTIFAAAKTAGVKHFIVEQDRTPGNPFDSIRISYDYLRKFTY